LIAACVGSEKLQPAAEFLLLPSFQYDFADYMHVLLLPANICSNHHLL
jgi:hypothetical protein